MAYIGLQETGVARVSYGIELSFNNKEQVIELPVVPGSIEISDGGKGKAYDVAELGEINVIKDQKLSEFGFSSMFPAHRYHFVTTDNLKGPAEYVKIILGWMEKNRPIRFIFTGDVFDINTPASIESFQWKEVAGSGGDIEYSIKLKKYVFYAAQKVKVVQGVVAGVSTTSVVKDTQPRASDKQTPKTYTMVAGDTLWSVAQKNLGDGARWKEIQQLNGITDAEIKRLPIGKVLKLPGDSNA